MEVASALASALFAAFSLPCVVLLLVAGETGLRLAAMAIRGERCTWPTRSAFLGYRITRPSAAAGGVFQQDDLLPPECLNALAVAAYRKGPPDAAAPAVDDCVFCLSRIEEGEEVRELRCRHVFHRGCLDAWLFRPRATCPLCRDRLLPSEPPSACTSADDDMYPRDYDIDDLPSSSASPAVVSSPFWHT